MITYEYLEDGQIHFSEAVEGGFKIGISSEEEAAILVDSGVDISPYTE